MKDVSVKDRQTILKQVVNDGLDKAQQRHVAPAILQALISLNWTEAGIAQYLGLTLGRVSQWSTGTTTVPLKHSTALYALLDKTLRLYDQKITELQEAGEWSLSAASWLRYRMANARSRLTRWRKAKPKREAA